MNKKALGLVAGVSILAAAGWMLSNSLSPEAETSSQREIFPQSSEPDQAEGRLRTPPPIPRSNWTKKTISQKSVVAKRSMRPKKAKNSSFQLIVAQKREQKPVAKNEAPKAPQYQPKLEREQTPSDTPWISNLSGAEAKLALDIKPEEGRKCQGTECAYLKDPGFSVVGVVMDTHRFGVSDQQLMRGKINNGDGKSTPFVYAD